MKMNRMGLLNCVAISLLGLLIGRRADAAQKIDRPAPTITAPSPTIPVEKKPPLPTPAPGAVVPAPTGSTTAVINVPEYSPVRLDFGEVWDGQSARKTFSLMTNAAGSVTVALPQPFRVLEFREMGPATPVEGRITPGQPTLPGQRRSVKVWMKYQEGDAGPWQWGLVAGAQIEIDVLFQPKFDLFNMTAGPKSATMKVTGPGPHGNWALSIPLQGMFNGKVIGAIFTMDDHDVLAVQGTQRIDVGARLIGTDSVLQGTIRGKNLPPGIQISPVPVTVNPGKTVQVKVPVTPAWGVLTTDAQARDVELVFEAGAKSSSAAFSLTPVPALVSSGGQRTDCGIGWLGWLAQLYPTGRVALSLSGQNQDFINDRHVIGIVNIAGKPVAWGIIHILLDPSGVAKSTFSHWDSSGVNADFAARFGTEDYLSAVRGPVTFSCHLDDGKLPF